MCVYMGTLRVVTARELVFLSASSRPTKIQSVGTAIYVVMRATRDTQVSNVEGWEINL